jgi:hypothetical protein
MSGCLECLSLCLPVCLSVCLSVCPSVSLSSCLFICLPACLSVCLSASSLSLSLISISLSLSYDLPLSIIYPLSIYLSPTLYCCLGSRLEAPPGKVDEIGKWSCMRKLTPFHMQTRLSKWHIKTYAGIFRRSASLLVGPPKSRLLACGFVMHHE